MKPEDRIVRVAVDTTVFHIDKPYDYLIPPDMEISPGQRVLVPFGRGNRRVEAMALAVTGQSVREGIKAVIKVLDPEPIVSENALRLAFWMNDRFYCTVYEALRAMLPIGLWFSLTETVALKQPFVPDAAYPLVEHDETASRALELLAQSKGRMPLDEWCAAVGAKWRKTLETLENLELAERVTLSARRHKDKLERIALLAQPPEEAQAYLNSLPRSASARRELIRLLMNDSMPIKELLFFSQASQSTLTKLVKSGIVSIELRDVPEIPERCANPPKITLNDEQEIAFRGIKSLLGVGEARCALLNGVTGSGKTLVYIKLLQEVIADGGRAIVLVPEIALTPQLIATFSDYFGDSVAVLHSALGMSERCEAWNTIRRGNVDVVVGTRSAVFAPLPDLKMIVIDEEQEYTYKSENSPRYHARDVAKFRCVQHGALLVLGSATPSLESAYSASRGVYESFVLAGRYNKRAMPEVCMADLKSELRNGNDTTISSTLESEIRQNLEAGEQTILFLNRRGFHRIVLCSSCGQTAQCPNCSVSLTFHAHNNRFMCHYCGHSTPVERRCASCGGELVFSGAGTQKVVDDLNTLFPGVEILRMDTDTTGYKGAHEALLNKFSRSKIPILVGTQMITKGLNIDNVTLVGVISADMLLFTDDFRASERAFGLITQVVGRAGRGGKTGRAVIQTFSPAHPVLLQAAAQDYGGFFETELALREAQGYPPFSDMILLNCFGANHELLLRSCIWLKGELDRAVKDSKLDIRVFGPAPAHVLKINNRFRYHITLCGTADKKVRQLVATLLRRFPAEPANKGVAAYADLHPNNF